MTLPAIDTLEEKKQLPPPHLFTSVLGSNIKGRTFNVPLTSINIIIGDNMTGKTAVLNTLMWAALGYVPGYDRTNPGIFAALASSNTMRVVLETNNGERIERVFLKDRKTGTVSRQDRVDGALPAIPPVMIDAQEFLGLSERGRTEALFKVMNLGDTPVTLRIQLVRERLQGESKRTVKALDDMDALPGESFQRWIERAIEFVQIERRTEEAEARKLEKATSTFAEQQLKVPDVNVAALEADLKAARAVLEAKRTLKSQSEVVLDSHASAAQRRLSLVQGNEKLRAAALTAKEIETNLTEWRAELKTILEGSEGDPSTVVVKGLQQREKSFNALAEMKATLNAIEQAQKALDAEQLEVMGQDKCPTCASHKITWKKNAQKKFDDRREDLTQQYKESTAALAMLSATHQCAHEAAQEAVKRAERYDELRMAINETEPKLARAHESAAALVSNEAELKLLEKEHGSGFDEETRQTAAAKAQNEFDDALEEVQALETKQSEIADAKAATKAAEEAALSRDLAKANVKDMTKGIEVLEQLRNDFMKDGFKPLLAIANLFTQGILPTPLDFRGGELGRMEKSAWISSRSFSRTEQGVAFAAISAALGSQSPIRLVLIDELSVMNQSYRERFMANIISAIKARVIDQFVGVDYDALPYMKINSEDGSEPINIIKISA